MPVSAMPGCTTNLVLGQWCFNRAESLMGLQDFAFDPLVNTLKNESASRVPASARALQSQSPPRMKPGRGAVLVSCCKVDKFIASRAMVGATNCWNLRTSRFIVASSVALREIFGVHLADFLGNNAIELSRCLVVLQVTPLARNERRPDEVGHGRKARAPGTVVVSLRCSLARCRKDSRNACRTWFET